MRAVSLDGLGLRVEENVDDIISPWAEMIVIAELEYAVILYGQLL